MDYVIYITFSRIKKNYEELKNGDILLYALIERSVMTLKSLS